MSHVSWLSDQFCIYKLKLGFLKRGSRITVATPSPLLAVRNLEKEEENVPLQIPSHLIDKINNW